MKNSFGKSPDPDIVGFPTNTSNSVMIKPEASRKQEAQFCVQKWHSLNFVFHDDEAKRLKDSLHQCQQCDLTVVNYGVVN